MPTRRTQHFLDIENLCGTADLYPEIVTSTFADYLQVTKAAPHDLFTVSTSHHNQKVAAFALRAIRSLHLLPPRSGPDGADMALIDGIAAARMNKDIDRICIGSGDHIFAFALTRLNNLGFHTTAVSRPEACSLHITRAASRVVYLPDHTATHIAYAQEIA